MVPKKSTLLIFSILVGFSASAQTGSVIVSPSQAKVISCGQSEAALLAANVPYLSLAGSRYFFGYRQTSADNQDPVVAKFTNGVQNWCRQDYEITGDDGRSYGLFWNGTDLYGLFTATGTQGAPAQDYRRFTGSGWLRTYSDGSPGGGGGPKVSILLKIDPATGQGLAGQGTFITSRLISNGKTNSLEIRDLYMNSDGHLVVRANSWFAPRRVNRTPMATTASTGGSPHDYTLVLSADLTTAVCTSAVNWDNGGITCNASPANGLAINSVSQFAFCGGTPASFSVGLAANGSFGVGNQFRVELSDAAGNFAAVPPVIGSGSASPITVSLPASQPVGNYRLRVTATDPAISSAPFASQLSVTNGTAWLGSVDSDWDNAANWSCGLPTAATDVVIPSAAPIMPEVLTANPVCRDFTLQAGAGLGGTGTLNLKGNWTAQGLFQAEVGLTVAANGSQAQTLAGQNSFFNLVIDNAANVALAGPAGVQNLLRLRNGNLAANGQLTLLSTEERTALVHHDGGQVLGPATVQRLVENYPGRVVGLGYTYFSSPVNRPAISELNDDEPLVLNPVYDWVDNPGPNPFPNLYIYDETKLGAGPYDLFERGWRSPASAAYQMENLRGLIFNLASGTTVDLRGELNNGPQNLNLTTGAGTNARWLLLGNPYPAPIDWDKAWDLNQTHLEAGIHRRIAQSRYTGTWAYYVANTPGGEGTNGATRYIALGQGFFGRAAQAGSVSLTFDNSVRLTVPPAQAAQFFRPENEIDEACDGLVKLRLVQGGQADEAIVYFRPGAGPAFDRAYDARKSQFNSRPWPNLFSHQGGKYFAVQALAPLTDEVLVPIGVSIGTAGSHTLELARQRFFLGQPELILEDRLSRTQHSLARGPYAFTAAAGLDTTRFVLRVKPDASAMAAARESQLQLSPNPTQNELNISLQGDRAETVQVTIADLQGRIVQQTQWRKPGLQLSRQVDVSGLARGVYVLILETPEGHLTRKWVKE
jgi:hypothetical protein